MKFFNLSEEQTIDLSELDFVDEMLEMVMFGIVLKRILKS